MAGIKISALPTAAAALLTDFIPTSQGLLTSKETWAQVLSLFAANASGLWGISISGNAATVTTNANLTGPITSVGNATTITDGAVTFPKIQNVAAFSVIGNNTAVPAPPTSVLVSSLVGAISANSLFGNPTGVMAAPIAISLGATLAFVAGALQTLALSGDVTTSANSFSTTIANNVVTYAKFQQVSANKLVGNPTGALSNIQEITLGATLSFVASSVQTLALSGDVTSSANSFVTTIANNAVTYAKFQQVAASSLVGNPFVVLSNASAITLGATLAFVGTALQSVALSGDVTTPTNSFFTTIANNAVTTAKIINAAVTYAKIQNVAASMVLGNPTGGSTSVSEISLGSTLTFVASALQTVALTGDVTTSANSFVTSIANNAVTTSKINNSAVTYAKIQNVGAFSVLGNNTAAPTPPTEILISTLLVSNGQNFIIGGEFGSNPWQRQTSFVNPASGTYTADRFQVSSNGAYTFNIIKSSDVPSFAVAGVHTAASLEMDFTNTFSPAANEYLAIVQPVEGYVFQNFAERDFTLSFNVKATLPGVYCVSFTNFTKCYIAEYTVNVANTWEHKTIHVTASPSTGFSYGNGLGIYVIFTVSCGSGLQTASPGVWQNGAFRASTNQVNAAINGDIFILDCIKIEIGGAETQYIIEPLSETLNNCYRYYYTSYPVGSYAGAIIDDGFEFGQIPFTTAGGSYLRSTTYQQSQRTNATVTIYSPRTGASGNYYDYNSGADKSATADLITTKGFLLRAGGVAVNPYPGFHYTSDAEI